MIIPPKAPSKRGRKKKQDPNLDTVAPEEKRKVQNRAAQRNFRQRREDHVRELELKINEQRLLLEQYSILIHRLHQENESLRRGEFAPKFPYVLPELSCPQSALQQTSLDPSPSSLDPLEPSTQKQAVVSPTLQNFALSLNDQKPIIPDPTLDFDSEIIADGVVYPPLFESFFPNTVMTDMDIFLPTQTQVSTQQQPPESDLEDDDLENSLPNGRIPCDKPECDFSTVSCSLPIPWRPPMLNTEMTDTETWGCKKAWAKLCSHPLFDECDCDELCHELRAHVRCSTDGRIVISKEDVKAVFRSIPERAKLNAMRVDMRRHIE